MEGEETSRAKDEGAGILQRSKRFSLRDTLQNFSTGFRPTGSSSQMRSEASSRKFTNENVEGESDVFLYASLNTNEGEIRLVELLPGSTDDRQINCNMLHTSIAQGRGGHQRRRYKALSYMWGSPDAGRSIELDGKFFLVRENLWQALYHIRSPLRPIVLWIDAICINQEDATERGHQVSMMGSIYSEAAGVIAWLGVESGDSTLALDTIATCARVHRNKVSRKRIAGVTPKRHATDKEFAAVLTLTEREYWKRIWILQEIIRGKTVIIQCGHTSITWYEFATFGLSLIEGSPEQVAMKASLAFEINQNRQMHEGHRSLLSLLKGTIESHASDPKDRIFALLGLVSKDDRFLKAVLHDELPDFGRWPAGTSQERWLIDYKKTALQLYVNLLTYTPWFFDNFENSIDEKEVYAAGRKLAVSFSQLLLRFLDNPGAESCTDSLHGTRLAASGEPLSDNIPPIRVQASGRSMKIHSLSPLFGLETPMEEILKWSESALSHGQFRNKSREFDGLRVLEALHSLTNTDLARLSPNHFLSSHPILQYNGVDYNQFIEGEREAYNNCQTFGKASSTGLPISKGTYRMFYTEDQKLGFVSPSSWVGDNIIRFEGSDVAIVSRRVYDAITGYRWYPQIELILGRAMFLRERASNAITYDNDSRLKYDVFQEEKRITSDWTSSHRLVSESLLRDLQQKPVVVALLPMEWRELSW